jgi:hypothetical protein
VFPVVAFFYFLFPIAGGTLDTKEEAMATTMDETRLKALLKTAVVEALNEHRDLVKEIVEEAIEDIALSHAIDEGLRTDPVPREAVLAILEGGR